MDKYSVFILPIAYERTSELRTTKTGGSTELVTIRMTSYQRYGRSRDEHDSLELKEPSSLTAQQNNTDTPMTKAQSAMGTTERRSLQNSLTFLAVGLKALVSGTRQMYPNFWMLFKEESMGCRC